MLLVEKVTVSAPVELLRVLRLVDVPGSGEQGEQKSQRLRSSLGYSFVQQLGLETVRKSLRKKSIRQLHC